jgi:hypothetical protein
MLIAACDAAFYCASDFLKIIYAKWPRRPDFAVAYILRETGPKNNFPLERKIPDFRKIR